MKSIKILSIAIGVLMILMLSICQSSDITSKEGYIDVTGGKVWYRIVNGGGTGTPLLLLHGGPGVPSFYLKPLAGAAVDRPVIFYDQLGCGKSDAPDDTSLYTIDRYVEELGQVRKALGLKEVDIYGHSWGTMLASEYMFTKPEGVKSLILASPSLSIPMWVKDANYLLTLLPDSLQETIKVCEEKGAYDSSAYQNAMMVYYHNFLARKHPWSDDLDSSMSMINPNVYNYMCGPSEFSITGTLKGFDCTSQLGSIDVPTLFTAGADDEVLTPTVKYYQSLIPGAEIAIFQSCGHITMHDDSASYVQSVRDFLNKVDAK